MWSSQQELLYYVVAPQYVVVGRPRGAGDRVAWLLEHQRWEDALDIARAERQQQPSMYEEVRCCRAAVVVLCWQRAGAVVGAAGWLWLLIFC